MRLLLSYYVPYCTLCHGGITPHIMGLSTLSLITAFLYLLAETSTGVTSVGAMLKDGVYSLSALYSGNHSGITYLSAPFGL